MDVSPLTWWLTIGITLAVLLFDVIVIGRRPHEPSRKEVTVALTGYIGLAVLFGIGVWFFAGHQYGTEFFAGWLTEYSLSVDNLFIFLIIMAKFGVPRKYQQTALMIGVAQVVALWPGTSRSFVTILAALALGCSLTVAVEFSFLLGFVTLSAATAYELLKDGKAMVDAFGVVNPIIGVVVAGIAAFASVKWMITYLERHQLTVFGWYRIGIGALVAVLLVTKAI